jgi:hypothetical protein
VTALEQKLAARPPAHPRLDASVAPPGAAVAVLRNVYTAAEVAAGGPAFYATLEAEFAAECAKYGPLASARAVPGEPSLDGAVVVAFATAAALDACHADMDGRWFDYRRLRVERYAPPASPAAALDDFFSSLQEPA